MIESNVAVVETPLVLQIGMFPQIPQNIPVKISYTAQAYINQIECFS